MAPVNAYTIFISRIFSAIQNDIETDIQESKGQIMKSIAILRPGLEI